MPGINTVCARSLAVPARGQLPLSAPPHIHATVPLCARRPAAAALRWLLSAAEPAVALAHQWPHCRSH